MKTKGYQLLLLIIIAFFSVPVFAYSDADINDAKYSNSKTLLEGFIQLFLGIAMIAGYKILKKKKQLL